MSIDRCPSTLRPGYITYSPAALRKVYFGKSVSHELPFRPPESDDEVSEQFMENRSRISISGVQKKLSLILVKNKLRLTRSGEHGQFILKPIPDDLTKPNQVPANEHLSMQLAEQVFEIPTAPNALIFFKGGQPAYITRRFDRTTAGEKLGMEDFASLSGKTRQTHGADFKYEGSCEDLFRLLKLYGGAYRVDSLRLFRLILFNYVISNGDAHLKNFSLLETPSGDYILSPAYDLLCTRLHVKDPDVAFTNGLFADDFATESFRANGYYAFDDFLALGLRAEIPEALVRRELAAVGASRPKVVDLVGRSYLSEECRELYLRYFDAKSGRLQYAFADARKSGN